MSFGNVTRLVLLPAQKVLERNPVSFCRGFLSGFPGFHSSIRLISWNEGRHRPQSRNMSKMSGANQRVPISVDIGDMRIKYKDKSETFSEDDLKSKEPFGQFQAWFDEARVTPGVLEPNAMCLATATKDGIPSARYVLLKGFGTDGFKFYTNYESRKGRELEENPNAALTFYWEPTRRSIRIEGTVEKTSAADSDEYFQNRPFHSQLGAHASKQSSVIAGRETLMVKERELLAQNTEGQVKRPECWGGFKVIPRSIEFWQGQSDRLHDRIRFRRREPHDKPDGILLHEGEDGWVYERLSP
ncbi:pyridoxine/pyridoxamine 5'-phosphate oxidase [Neodiprion virginianus]|uniref:pyridoxine/pyridoxamine 5'-phosphate oxidase n=1 Tax=Neodiprion fabricii TaxID=2872261 RepID=UPI001ED961CE|nr:pyridoxine/pyridoxamine 5'-phosphate oxidase [Neodiprion fabricii]XP_046603673.1 pyridoxine/pyridoxamine 5'-phosphate oxidase [Neodiprion virginianus]